MSPTVFKTETSLAKPFSQSLFCLVRLFDVKKKIWQSTNFKESAFSIVRRAKGLIIFSFYFFTRRWTNKLSTLQEHTMNSRFRLGSIFRPFELKIFQKISLIGLSRCLLFPNWFFVVPFLIKKIETYETERSTKNSLEIIFFLPSKE